MHMSTLLEQAWRKVTALPSDEQDVIAAQILDRLGEEEVWQRFFASRREEFERMAEKARDEHRRGLTQPLEELLDAIPHDR
jgi:hypothetical protein